MASSRYSLQASWVLMNVKSSQGTLKGLAWVNACVKDGHNDPSAVILRVFLQSRVVPVPYAD